MKQWSRRFFSTTAGQIVQRLASGPLSVMDLAEALQLTPNAIRASLSKLERDGFVKPAGKRAAFRKPHDLYALTPEAGQLFARAYHVLINLLIDSMNARLPAARVEEMLSEVGRAVAASYRAPASGVNGRKRVEHAAGVLRDLGGVPDVRRSGDGWVIEGRRCPIELLVREHPEACGVAQAMLSELIGRPVREQCERNGEVRCRFFVEG